MKCEKCRDDGNESVIEVGVSATTLIHSSSYYDEKGNFHHNNPNTTTTDYKCSRGHRWKERSKGVETLDITWL